MLILVGSAIIVFEAIRHLVDGTEVERLGVGIAVLGVSVVVNLVVSRDLSTARARRTDSPALDGDAAHLRTDALTSVGVLVGAGPRRRSPAPTGSTRSIALVVAAAIVVTGVRIALAAPRACSSTRRCRTRSSTRSARWSRTFADARRRRLPRAARRRAGARRYVDLHVQFRAGTSLEDAHRIAHELQDAIASRLGRADVLIHLEPEDRVRPGEEVTTGEPPPVRPMAGSPWG